LPIARRQWVFRGGCALSVDHDGGSPIELIFKRRVYGFARKLSTLDDGSDDVLIVGTWRFRRSGSASTWTCSG
jgi:hypothetical protein